VDLSRHALTKLETYGIDGERLQSWWQAVQGGKRFLDLGTGAVVVLAEWEHRPWIAILSQDGKRIVTLYPTDHRTVTNRLEAGRWIQPST
jgi:hypothetical protein